MSNDTKNNNINYNNGNSAKNDSIKNYNNIENLKQQIEKFKQKQKNSNTIATNVKNKNLAIVYNVVADLIGGIITAFILNKIYSYFFCKNTFIFALLLLICSIAGLYNTMRLYIKK